MTDDKLRAADGYVLEYDAEYRWLVMSDPEGASQIVARDVRPDDAVYLIAGYAALAASVTDEPTDNTLRAALEREHTLRVPPPYSEYHVANCETCRLLAASATDEGPLREATDHDHHKHIHVDPRVRERVRDYVVTHKISYSAFVERALTALARPAVPEALDVERLAKVFQGDVMADWLGIVVGITDPKHPPLAEGFARDFAADIAREYAASATDEPTDNTLRAALERLAADAEAYTASTGVDYLRPAIEQARAALAASATEVPQPVTPDLRRAFGTRPAVSEALDRETTYVVGKRGGKLVPVPYMVRPAVPALDVERAIRLVDEVIFDLPIGEDVAYSRGYSAGVAAARESLRDALAALRSKEPTDDR